MSVPVVLLDQLTREEIRDAKGNATVQLGAVPQKGDLVSFGRRAFEVREVWHVHNSATRLVVSEWAQARGYRSDRPEVANLSNR